ncbi:MAG TPA: SpoIIE family protein phosphatase, partial [Acidimicrobiales bacterium]|nr:SpoIIE family protein phosphatase [Acidimicrobiales bacterium]
MSTRRVRVGAPKDERQLLAQLVLGREPDAVPKARRFARANLTEEMDEVASDAELVVSELVTNAFLHGEPPITVSLVSMPERLRVEVEDSGERMPVPWQRTGEAMTGRGLSLVRTLCCAWGVERLARGGKLVWAEVAPAARPSDEEPFSPDIAALLEAWDDLEPASSWFTVDLGPVPTELLLSAKAQMDNMVRELALIEEGEASRGAALDPELAALVQTVTQEFAEVRTEIKLQAAAAAAGGDPVTYLKLRVPATVADAGERYLAALDRTDRLARSGRFLALAPPLVHRVFRRWYVRSLVDQVRAFSEGQEPAPLRPLDLVLAGEVTRLSQLEDTAVRLALLQSVSAELASAGTPEEMAQVVCDNLVQVRGIVSARVRLLTEGGTLRSVAWSGKEVARPDIMPEMPLSSDLPGALAARTRRPVFIQSITGLLQRFPELAPAYPDERSVQFMPLMAGEQTLGMLSVTLVAGEISDQARVDLVEAIAGVLSGALHRAQLATREEEVRETLAFLADATAILVSAREPGEVLERLVRHAVPRIGDWCTVYLMEGKVLRRVAMAIEGLPQLAERLKASPPLTLDMDLPQVRAYLTGEPQPILEGTGRLLETIYPGLDFAALGGDPEQASGVCVPMRLRGERIGVIALTFLRSGRRLSPGSLEAISGLGARAALALDNAKRWSLQREALQGLVSALLPSEPPIIPGIEFAARYLPAAGDVAGDWWEADLMPDGTVLLGLGDAAGHGVGAVSQMCELRHGARALAAVERSPAALLADLNRRLAGPDAGFATAFYGRLIPGTGELRWASAGHVPPLHVRADGRARPLGSSGGAPLGTPISTPGADHWLVLAPGESLVLYSDGVVETRDQGLDDGIAR